MSRMNATDPARLVQGGNAWYPPNSDDDFLKQENALTIALRWLFLLFMGGALAFFAVGLLLWLLGIV